MPKNEPEKATMATKEGECWPIVGMTVKETAQALRISQRACQDLLASGVLPGRLVAGRWRVSPTALDKWLDYHGSGKTRSDKD